MEKIIRGLRKYPLVLVFFIFLLGFSVLDALWPKRERSELENRSLAQYPIISVSGLLTNKWMVDYESYVKDQFAFRDTWIDLKSLSETAILKTENNGILLGKDGYLFKKTFALDEVRLTRNIEAIEKFSQRHPGIADVMIVPSAATILQDKLPLAVPLTHEDTYLDTIVSRLSPVATVYDLRPTLRAHQAEPIFYRTDHHWTSEGAFLAYEDYVLSKGLPVFDRQSVPAKTVPEFYGTHYSSARNFNVISDTIVYYDLPNTLTVYPKPGVEGQPGGLYELEKFETRDKYAAFLRGNNSYSEIQGSGEGSLLIVKDSYANSFVPYLVNNYAKIGIVDFRQNPQKLDQILTEGGFERVLFLYSLDAFASDTYFTAKVAVA